MERLLGMVGGKPSRARAIILRNNGIKTRYYAIDENGKSTHSNAQLVAEAVRGLFGNGFYADDVQLLACGTTSPDQLLPSHAAMVHGELKGKSIELISATGACCAGMQAMKYAAMSIQCGNVDNAVCAGSEKLSTWMQAGKFQPEADNLNNLNENPYIAFEKDFLRWMLSDGAGAALLQHEPAGEGLSLRVEWIDIVSFANEIETCMYAGSVKLEDGNLLGWNDMEPEDWNNQSVFSLKQDVKMLGQYVVPLGVRRLNDLMQEKGMTSADIDFLLPHMSSEFFRSKIREEFEKYGMDFPEEKWFTNLTRVGNVGTASPYLMLEELLGSGKLKKGNTVMLMVPESARFSYSFAFFTVV